jgi:2-C-methyl-D-erythritol 4-phosphate cytidylyltransferase/2-C-methyl-D-erythritol 2,4-cyclodiphosphate synthase
MPRTAALIVAAGRGVRAGRGVPKQYRAVGGRLLLSWVLDRFLGHPDIDAVCVVIHADDVSLYQAAVPAHASLLPPVFGGETRQESVLRGLEALADDPPDFVLIHDAVRIFVAGSLISEVVRSLGEFEAALPATPVTDTLQQVDADGFAFQTLPRAGLWQAETPQGFRFPAILAAHRRASAGGAVFTDDAAVAAFAGVPVKVVHGSGGSNIKLTTPEDFAMADARLAAERFSGLDDVRVGIGYDVHATGTGKSVMLGGMKIPHSKGLEGHSDADVALHALTDAILGAIAEGDIGTHFPPDDPKWKGAASDRFLGEAAAKVQRRGGAIAHLDLTIIAEAPRIEPHRDAMRARIGSICGIPVERVAVKATTNEALGFVGRGEGIAAMATATVRLPSGEKR